MAAPRKRAAAKSTVSTPKKGGASDAKKARALAAFVGVGTVTGACESAGIDRKTWYNWIKADPAFAGRVKAAEEDVADGLEAEAIRRATAGSDTLLIFLLKGHKPERFRERYEAKVDATVAHYIAEVPAKAPDADTWARQYGRPA